MGLVAVKMEEGVYYFSPWASGRSPSGSTDSWAPAPGPHHTQSYALLLSGAAEEFNRILRPWQSTSTLKVIAMSHICVKFINQLE
jgi:hypothetical protein